MSLATHVAYTLARFDVSFETFETSESSRTPTRCVSENSAVHTDPRRARCSIACHPARASIPPVRSHRM